MADQNSTTVETQKEVTGKTVFGVQGLNNPTPMWATWIFRIIFLATSATLVIIAADETIPANIKFKIALYLKAGDVFIWGIARGFGVDKSQFEK